MRVLIAVTHLLGAGHLTRAAALARAFAAAGHEAVLVSGGVPAPLVRLDGVRLVQLPPLRVVGTDFSRPLGPDGTPADAALLDRRRELILDALAASDPDAVITELFPFGRRALASEFLALVEAARARRPRPVVLASVRDILVAPDRPERVAQAHARLAALYDAVLVHGDPTLVRLDASWPLDAATAARIRYTGYVDEGGPVAPVPARRGVVVAAGSSAAGLGLFAVAAEAARRRPDLAWRLLLGHGVPEAALAAIGRGLPEGVVARARPDYRALLAEAALSVSQCGYNTAVDLLVTGTPSVLVPFEAGRETEQRLRAERLAARGLAGVLPEADLSADALLAAVAAGLAAPRPAPHGIDLGGAARSVAIVEELIRLEPCPSALRQSTAPSHCFDALSRAEPASTSAESALSGRSREGVFDAVGRLPQECLGDASVPSPERYGPRTSLTEEGDRRSHAPPPPSAGEGGPRSGSGEGSTASGEIATGVTSYGVAPPLSRPLLTQGPPSPAEGGGHARAVRDLLRTLDRVAEAGARVAFWWRDDDAVAASPALDRLLDLAGRHAVPLLIAAIPARVEPSLARRLDGAAGVSLAVHGLAHADHAPAGGKPAEFGDHRPLDRLAADAAEGLRRARTSLPGNSLLPVFVPPWNRLAPALAAALPGLGYRGLSAVPGPDVPGLARADATLDPIDWRGTRSLRDAPTLLSALAGALARDPARPVGLLTHHRVHDAAIWAFLEALLPVLAGHPAVVVADPRALFSDPAMDSGAAASTFPDRAFARTG